MQQRWSHYHQMPMVDSGHGGFGSGFKFPPDQKIDDFGVPIPRVRPKDPMVPKSVTGDYEEVVRRAPEGAWLDNPQRCMLDPKSMRYHMPGHPLFMPGREPAPKKNLEYVKRDLAAIASPTTQASRRGWRTKQSRCCGQRKSSPRCTCVGKRTIGASHATRKDGLKFSQQRCLRKPDLVTLLDQVLGL